MDEKNNDQRAWDLMEKVVTDSMSEQRKARRWSVVFKSLTFAYLFILLFLFLSGDKTPTHISGGGKHTAVIDVHGIIKDKEEASAGTIVKALRDAFKDKHTAAVLLRINSPGGSPVQSGYIYDEIKRLRKLHPDIKLYSVISDIGASGAYYIAAASDAIYANRASLVGSIGVISANFGYTELMKKLGVERRVFTSGENKAFLDPYQELPEEQRQFWNSVLGITHQQFIDVVKEGRGDVLSDEPKLFSGLIWTGEQALELGLIDGLGSPGYVAREVIGVEKVVNFTVSPHPLDRLVKKLGIAVGHGISQSMGLEQDFQIR